MGEFHQIFTELSARDTPIFSFPDNSLSKYQGILNKLGTSIVIKEIWFGIANGQISSIFDGVICPQHDDGGYYRFAFLFNVTLLIQSFPIASITTKLCSYNPFSSLARSSGRDIALSAASALENV